MRQRTLQETHVQYCTSGPLMTFTWHGFGGTHLASAPTGVWWFTLLHNLLWLAARTSRMSCRACRQAAIEMNFDQTFQPKLTGRWLPRKDSRSEVASCSLHRTRLMNCLLGRLASLAPSSMPGGCPPTSCRTSRSNLRTPFLGLPRLLFGADMRELSAE